jgi:hypothetical protein
VDEEPLATLVVLAPDGEPTGPVARSGERSARRRTLAGLVVLVLTATVLVVLNRVTAQRIAGTPQTDWPAPPAVGMCVNLLSGAGGVAVVPCDGPHDAEVTKAYSALDPVLSASPSASIDSACADAARAYLGADAGGELPTVANSADGLDHVLALGLNFAASAAGAPAAERAGDLGWTVCDIQPAQAVRYSGSVRGATVADAPDAYRWCWSETDRQSPVSCTEPHAAEVLGVAPAYTGDTLTVVVEAPPNDPTTGPSEAELAHDRAESSRRISRAINETMQQRVQARRETLSRQCSALAAEELGVADPTYGGLLETTMADIGGASARVIMVPDDRNRYSPAAASDGERADSAGTDARTTLSMDVRFGLQYCLVAAPSGSQITGSLTGWGDRPPPLTADK